MTTKRQTTEIVIGRAARKEAMVDERGGDDGLETIVGEVTVNWCHAQPDGQQLASQRFEIMIEHNRRRGYDLVSHSLSSVVFQDAGGARLCETIIAVFRKRGAR